jgi:hypothetical protein
MADLPGQFETTDRVGTTTHFNGAASTTPALIPSVAGDSIAEVLIRSLLENPKADLLQVSFDGVEYFTLNRSEHIVWGVKGDLKQIYVRATSGAPKYEIIMNRELA